MAGGKRLRVPSLGQHPQSVRARQRLIDLVGVRLAEDLITNFGMTQVYIPKGPSPHNSVANPISAREVARLTRKGQSARQIAEKLGCSTRTIHLKRAQVAARKRKFPRTHRIA